MMGGSRKLVLLALLAAALLPGCRGCVRENVVYEHTFNRPDCRLGPVKACPPQCPEFELPPGGPYLSSPGPAPCRAR